LRHGDAIALLLFNIMLETAIISSKVDTQGTIFDKCSQIVAYGGDVVVIGKRLQDFEEELSSLV
jgi:hypothetical protein